MPDQISFGDTLLGTKGTSDSGRQGYVLNVTMPAGAAAGAVQGAAANGAAPSGNPVLVAGTDGTLARTLSTDTGGRVNMVPYVGTVAIGAAVTNTDGVVSSATANSLRTSSYSLLWNGASYDRQRKINLYARVVSSAAAGNPAVGKAAAGDLRGFWGENGATKTYLQIYNLATTPVLGTSTPIMTYPIPANAVFNQSFGDGAYNGTGIAYAFTTDAAGTTGAAAAAITAFSLMMA